jgi:hypothetical protein
MFKFMLSSGLFCLPSTAASVDWAAVNNAPNPQNIRVTVYQGGVAGPKTPIAPGPLSVTLQPACVTHNANPVGPTQPFVPGMYYEIVVETNDRRVLPVVDVWSDLGGTLVPGTRISARDFLHLIEP